MSESSLRKKMASREKAAQLVEAMKTPKKCDELLEDVFADLQITLVMKGYRLSPECQKWFSEAPGKYRSQFIEALITVTAEELTDEDVDQFLPVCDNPAFQKYLELNDKMADKMEEYTVVIMDQIVEEVRVIIEAEFRK